MLTNSSYLSIIPFEVRLLARTEQKWFVQYMWVCVMQLCPVCISVALQVCNRADLSILLIVFFEDNSPFVFFTCCCISFWFANFDAHLHTYIYIYYSLHMTSGMFYHFYHSICTCVSTYLVCVLFTSLSVTFAAEEFLVYPTWLLKGGSKKGQNFWRLKKKKREDKKKAVS